jgi:hypothetical protein
MVAPDSTFDPTKAATLALINRIEGPVGNVQTIPDGLAVVPLDTPYTGVSLPTLQTNPTGLTQTPQTGVPGIASMVSAYGYGSTLENTITGVTQTGNQINYVTKRDTSQVGIANTATLNYSGRSDSETRMQFLVTYPNVIPVMILNGNFSLVNGQIVATTSPTPSGAIGGDSGGPIYTLDPQTQTISQLAGIIFGDKVQVTARTGPPPTARITNRQTMAFPIAETSAWLVQQMAALSCTVPSCNCPPDPPGAPSTDTFQWNGEICQKTSCVASAATVGPGYCTAAGANTGMWVTSAVDDSNCNQNQATAPSSPVMPAPQPISQ